MKTKILSISTLILALGTISLCFRNYQLRLRSPQQRVVTKIDTVYLEKSFETTSYNEVSSPTKITVYTKGLVKDTSSTQKKDSVVQFKLDKTSLDLTLYNVLDSTVHTDTYQLDLNKYKYTFSNGLLTQKRTYNLRFSPYLQAKIRPINQFFDLSGGISLKSNHFTYGLGLGIGYYPKLSSRLHKDIEVMVNYNF